MKAVVLQVAHEVHHGTVSKDAERMSGQLDTFKSEIKHDVCFLLLCSTTTHAPFLSQGQLWLLDMNWTSSARGR